MLAFTSVDYGEAEEPWTLAPLLHKGGAALSCSEFLQRHANNSLAPIIEARREMLSKLYDVLEGDFGAGGSRYTLGGRVYALRQFYKWADSNGLDPDMASSEGQVRDWSHALLDRARRREIKPVSVSTLVSRVCAVMDRVHERSTPLYKTTPVGHLARKRWRYRQSDTVLIEHTLACGAALLDVSNALSVEAISAPEPVAIRLRNGEAFDAPWPVGRRNPLLNLKIDAELLIFIAQTGMNLGQAHRLTAETFRYRSHPDGYQVRRIYKARRHGEVEFLIYKEYRDHLERYLEWRRHFFPEEDRLFPSASRVKRSRDVPPTFATISRIFESLNVPFVSARRLRRARVNWLKRASNDTAMTAEMLQHSVETLLSSYDIPDHQNAALEISRFHEHAGGSPAIPAPGICAGGSPHKLSSAPASSAKPDCINPSGCLFCEHHRDLDSFDHIWSLASYMHLKSIELARMRFAAGAIGPSPARATIDRLTEKLDALASTSSTRHSWVDEARMRVLEEDYHPTWDGFIQLAEAVNGVHVA